MRRVKGATPLPAMTRAMGRLAAGDTGVDVPAVGRRDGVGRMADAVQTFKTAAIENRRLESEADAQRGSAKEIRAQTAAEQAAVSPLRPAAAYWKAGGAAAGAGLGGVPAFKPAKTFNTSGSIGFFPSSWLRM
jgi:hypothetical protein